jgi:hypothetical protein
VDLALAGGDVTARAAWLNEAPPRSTGAVPLLASALLALLAACNGTASPLGVDEPLRVQNAAFKSGELPGSPPPEDPSDPGEDRDQPLVTQLMSQNLSALPGQVGKRITGFASDDAYSVGLRFADAGSGYWVLPVGAPDANYPDQLSFVATVDLSIELDEGEHVLQVVAFDAHGHAGQQYEYRFCALRPYDHTRNACDPTIPPPAAVISLVWDVDADLDLVVRTPSGKLVDADHPATVEVSDSEPPDPEQRGVGILERDSNAECRIDSARRESLIWNGAPEPGTYLIYVNVFEACGKSAAHFAVESYVRVRGADEGTFDIAPLQEPLRGVVLGASANGGGKSGLFAGTIELPVGSD